MSKTEGASQLGQNETSQVILSHLNHHPSKHIKSRHGTADGSQRPEDLPRIDG